MAQGRRSKSRTVEVLSEKEGNAQTFSVISYNVLSDVLLYNNRDLYPQSNNNFLPWVYRRDGLIKEILSCDAEIVCLQEVEELHWTSFFLPELRRIGYDGLYMSRIGAKTDGCALFFRTSAFKLVGQRFVEYKRPGLRVLDRDNVALLAMLQSVSPSCGDDTKPPELLCVATTHILFNINRGDIKLAQMMVLMAEIENFSTLLGPNGRDVVMCPVVVAGDFNSRPDSPLYNFLECGRLDYSRFSAKSMDGEHRVDGRHNPMVDAASNAGRYLPASVGISNQCHFEEQQMHTAHTVAHSLRLQSVYDSPHHRKLFTTRHIMATAIVDYIFFSSQSTFHRWWRRSGRHPYHRTLRLLSRLELPSMEDASSFFPDNDHPSDHIALQAFFQFANPDY